MSKSLIRVSGLTAAIVAVVALVGCTSSPAPTASVTASASPTATPTPTVTPVPMAIEPLRGVAVPVGTASLKTPSIASKIDNHPLARPQVGLQLTDLVYEELVEGGLTRYVAVWQSEVPKEYGPVRSIRGMDPDIISPMKGIVTYSGGQAIFVAGMHDTPVVNVVHGAVGTGDVFYRTTTKVAPHNVITRTAQLLAAFGKKVAPPAQQYQYGATAAEASAATGGTATSKITETFSSGSIRTWVWDAGTQKWFRSQNGVKDLDSNGHQLRATNVVTIRVKTTVVSHTPKTLLVGSGVAAVSTGGKTVQGTWSKKSKTDKLVLTLKSGRPMTLAPGNTWIELVPVYGKVSFQ